MIVVTGAAGFIASVLVGRLNEQGYKNIVVVDDFSNDKKNKNLENKSITARVDRENFDNWLKRNGEHVEFIFHLGARTDTAEFDKSIFDHLNVNYSKMVWEKCIEYGIPLVYASSAATYGLGEHG
ncbi:MAG: NAD-dependent epimerase/dehydratase family protein, partial [Salibacter sp.]